MLRSIASYLSFVSAYVAVSFFLKAMLIDSPDEAPMRWVVIWIAAGVAGVLRVYVWLGDRAALREFVAMQSQAPASLHSDR